MESSPDRENSRGTTEHQVAGDTVHKHGTQEVSSAEDAAAAASLVRGAQERMSSSERLEGSRESVAWSVERCCASCHDAGDGEHLAHPGFQGELKRPTGGGDTPC